MRTRVKHDTGLWYVDHRIIGLVWWPFGHWIHQDWWVAYAFDTLAEALSFEAKVLGRAALGAKP